MDQPSPDLLGKRNRARSRQPQLFLVGALLAATLLLPSLAHALDPVYSNWRGLAIRGTDPVAYFTESKPVQGSSDHTLEYKGATWRFSSAANRATFQAEPRKVCTAIRRLLRLGRFPRLHREYRSRRLDHRQRKALSELQRKRDERLARRPRPVDLEGRRKLAWPARRLRRRITPHPRQTAGAAAIPGSLEPIAKGPPRKAGVDRQLGDQRLTRRRAPIGPGESADPPGLRSAGRTYVRPLRSGR